MIRPRQFSRTAVVAALVFLGAAGGRPVLSDDTDLLRFSTAKPYVFFLLDTSASMTLSPAGKWVHANGDDPRSKLYQAKRVLYDVFQEVDDVHYGFASMNQDNGGAASKHWLYYSTAALPAGWPINYPRPDADGPVQIQADGTAVDDVEGDLMTFGTHFDATGVAASCASPLSLNTQIEKINRYSKLGAAGNGPTVIWLASGGKTYRLTVTRPGNKPDTSPNSALGQDGMNVKLDLDEVKTCVPLDVQNNRTLNLDLTLWTDFLILDEDVNSVDAPKTGKANGVDNVAGFWSVRDILDSSSCGSGHPFSGKGWEGNYDGDSVLPIPGGLAGSLAPADDPHCASGSNNASCYNVKKATTYDPLGRPLDRGDVLPLDWRTENKEDFLDRLAPNQSSGTPDFRIASYYKDSPDATTGVLPLESASRSPLMGTGASPLGKMVIDFRCWYLGEGNKCNESAYNPGWEAIAQSRDSEWGCRRPYLIVISDGGDSCTGENPCADTASLNSKAGVRTWVIAYGANCSAVGNPLKCMAQNGKGELLCPQTASDLKTELLKILGQIREEARAFASAAVPSVQAVVDDKIFLTNFTPLNGKPVWDGHVHSFLKPLPIRESDGKPDTSSPRHLWDGADVMRLTQVNPPDPLGSSATQRRVYYSRESTTGLFAGTRRLLDPTTKGVDDDAVRRDLWRALEVPFTQGNLSSEASAETDANQVIQKTLAVKSHTFTTIDPATGKTVTLTLQYLLGDIFHSNPLVIGNPPNTLYFNLGDLLGVPGYQDFFRKHRWRRKMLLVGSNDGMLHAFEAGLFDTATQKFSNGTGKELFAYIPREVMPTIKKLADGTTHKWGVDGTVVVSDVFIDPLHTGTPTAAEREWRSVVVGGLREGGSAYFALDITQPDQLSTVSGLLNVPQPANGYVPSCLGGDAGTVDPTRCGPVPFPVGLWEWDDSVRSATGERVRLDEDALGGADLGTTWSTPNVGLIRVTEAGKTVAKSVMVVGGGFDVGNKTAPAKGNWLYMIDVETGQAIYKRKLVGAIPSEPAAVDTDQDGFLDRIYIGTTAGQMYRVDLTPDSSKVYPALTSQAVRAVDGLLYTVKRIPVADWAPRLIFNANTEAGVPLPSTQTRPIYYRPSVVFVPKLGLYALSFGTGDREDLWNYTNVGGRFYVFVDDTDASSTVLTEGDFTRVLVTSPATTAQPLLAGLTGHRGWYIVLDPDERMITDPFALSGVSFFSTFKPNVQVIGGKDPLCSKTGISRIFVVSTVNANPYLRDANDIPVRNLTVSNFVTNPFTEAGLTKNQTGGGTGSSTTELCDTDTMRKLRDALKALFPVNCKFSNQTVDIKTISSDTRLLCIAPIPVCTVENNWREQ